MQVDPNFQNLHRLIDQLPVQQKLKSSLGSEIHETQALVQQAIARSERRAQASEVELQKTVKELHETESRLSQRYEKLLNDSANRVASLENQHSQILERYAELEKSSFSKQRDLEAEFKRRTSALQDREAQLSALFHEYEAERTLLRDESQKNIQDNSRTFVKETVASLETRGTRLSRISFWWSIFGGAALFVGSAVLVALTIIAAINVTSDISWKQLVFYLMKGTVFLGAALLMARYAFIFSSNYMKESLRTLDKVHAIKFGQFFVNTYGASASWEEVQQVFSNWNGHSGIDWDTSTHTLSGHGLTPAEVASAGKAAQ